ncbi:hypothetical protein PQ456_00930 [Paenibacillus kyungheensis]|uniref:Uncharacterized protein n=1 Tax=Paenibacillus kyungheensis TaxID=1452732 RepID=A0AAX3M1M0_9BACL|nr:hypothetical protein [Paenibacillus kyungheensis]WCT56120.1 hypothetical protein PQ456_00930 [Paenibacillus kyungheensis]
MQQNKSNYQNKWGFLNKKPYQPGNIIETVEDIDVWMVDNPYIIAENRINTGSIEDTILEFIELFWSIEPDYRLLSVVLQVNLAKNFYKEYIFVKASYKNKIGVPKLKEIHMMLDPDTEYIQTFELILYEMPDVTILNEKVKQLSQELVFEHEHNKLKLMVSGKTLIISN